MAESLFPLPIKEFFELIKLFSPFPIKENETSLPKIVFPDPFPINGLPFEPLLYIILSLPFIIDEKNPVPVITFLCPFKII